MSNARKRHFMLQMWKHRALGQELRNGSSKPHQLWQNYGLQPTTRRCKPHPHNSRTAETNSIQPHTPTTRWIGKHHGTTRGGFSKCLIRSALIRQSSDKNVYLSARKSMTIRFYIHSIAKRAKSIALLDSGAKENFMNLAYAEWLQLPIKQLPKPRSVLNVMAWKTKVAS